MSAPSAKEIEGARVKQVLLELVRIFPSLRSQSYKEWRARAGEQAEEFTRAAYETVQELEKFLRG